MLDVTKVIKACPSEARGVLVARLAAALMPSLAITLRRAGDETVPEHEAAYWMRKSYRTLTDIVELIVDSDVLVEEIEDD